MTLEELKKYNSGLIENKDYMSIKKLVDNNEVEVVSSMRGMGVIVTEFKIIETDEIKTVKALEFCPKRALGVI